MAQFYKIFNEENCDIDEWTFPVTPNVFAWDSGEEALGIQPSVERYSAQWNPPGVSDALQIRALCKFNLFGGRTGGVAARIKSLDTTRGTAYTSQNSSSTSARLCRFDGDAGTNEVNLTTTVSWDCRIWHWRLLEVSGNTIRHKLYTGVADDEPSDWTHETTDSTYSGDGGVGLFFRIMNTSFYVREIYVGTDGDPAPTGPVDVSAEPFLLRHNPRTNKVIPVLSSPTVTDIGANCARPRVSKGY